MKTIEEKARAYDEALEKAKEILEMTSDKSAIYTIFPELGESEGEKVRKELIDAVQGLWDNDALPMPLSVKRKDKWLAWLEKQGEHANFRDKAQVGDRIAKNEDGMLVNLSQLNRVAKPSEKQGKQKFEMKTAEESLGISSDEYNKIVDECIFGEQKPEENKENIGGISPNWSEEDEKNLRRAIRATKVVYPVAADWLKSLQDRVGCEANCTTTKEWSEEDEELVKWSINNLTELKDRYGEEYGKVGKCIDWLKSLQDRVQPQPKQGEQNLVLRDTFGYEDGRLFGMNEGIGLVLDNPEKYGLQKPIKWSKEDENVISLILSICNDFLESFEISPASTKVVKEDVDKIENWLKSLRPQNRWKPSELQLECLSDAIEYYNSLGYPASKLKELLDDLKKLKGEV